MRARQSGSDASATRERFIEAMDDDLNSPQAVAALFDLVRDINRGSVEGADVSEAQETLVELTGVLGPDAAGARGCAERRCVRSRSGARGASG